MMWEDFMRIISRFIGAVFMISVAVGALAGLGWIFYALFDIVFR